MTDLMPKLTKSHGEIIFMFSIYFFIKMYIMDLLLNF